MNPPTRELETQDERVAAWMVEADVMLWLRAQAAIVGIKGLVLAIDTSQDRLCCWAELNGRYEYGTTLQQAIDKIKVHVPTAARLRQEANRLLEQAAETEYQAAREEEQRTEAKKHQPKVSFHD